jgi:hypothetical protein
MSLHLTADQLRGRVHVLIDGEDRILRFDQGALVRIVSGLGLKGLEELPSVMQSLNGDVLRVLMWAGCLHENEELELCEVEKWFYPALPSFISCIEGINLAIWGRPDGPEEVDDDENPTKKMENGLDGTSEKQSEPQSVDLD